MKKTINFIPNSTAENLKLLSFPDCVHLSDTGKCRILSVFECIGESCSFHQTLKEKRDSDHDYLCHINSLSEEKQSKIAAKYYDGRKPWKEQFEKSEEHV